MRRYGCGYTRDMTRTMSIGQIIRNAKDERPQVNPVLVALRVTRDAADLTGRPLLTIYREDEVSNADAVRILSATLETI